MFGSLFGKKNISTPNSSIEPSAEPAVETVEKETESALNAAAQPDPNNLALDGLTIEEYAKQQNLSHDEVWSRLRKGQLVGRTSRGKVLVYESISAAAMAAPTSPARTPSGDDLPPLEFGARTDKNDAESKDPTTNQAGAVSAGSLLALETMGGAGSTELALLLDHLSLAKEENREILRLTQDTLTKLSSMTDAVVQMKDEIIKTKDQQLAALQSAMAESEKNIAKLRQEKEDLEILNRTLGSALTGDAAPPRR